MTSIIDGQACSRSVFAGAASASSDSGAAAGAAVAWELTPRFTIDGTGIWADGPHGSDRKFTDFAVAVGGGIDIFLHRHIAFRPDVRVLFAMDDSSARPVPFVGINLAYHFESHDVTPTRRSAP